VGSISIRVIDDMLHIVMQVTYGMMCWDVDKSVQSPNSPVVGRICAPFGRQEIQIKKLVSNGKKTHEKSSIRAN